jgi:hypothetical protein
MSWIVGRIKGIMLVTGALTCSMVIVVLAPQAALRLIFGETLNGAVAEIVVRSWGSLIALVGATLIYGAYDPPGRRFILSVAGLGKLTFVGLVLVYGRELLGQLVGFLVVADSVMVVLFALYLIGVRGRPAAA